MHLFQRQQRYGLRAAKRLLSRIEDHCVACDVQAQLRHCLSCKIRLHPESMSAVFHGGIRGHEPQVLHFLQLRISKLHFVWEERILLRNRNRIAPILTESIRYLSVKVKRRAACIHHKPVLAACAVQNAGAVPFLQGLIADGILSDSVLQLIASRLVRAVLGIGFCGFSRIPFCPSTGSISFGSGSIRLSACFALCIFVSASLIAICGNASLTIDTALHRIFDVSF